jgi:small subunit ribosomal protein S19
MSRSLKKGPFIDPKLWAKVQKAKPGSKTEIKTWSRDSTIFPEMVGMSFSVHNGKNFITVNVSENMVGHKLGEFSPTRKFIRHGGRMAKEEALAAAEAEKRAQEAAKAPAEGAKK